MPQTPPIPCISHDQHEHVLHCMWHDGTSSTDALRQSATFMACVCLHAAHHPAAPCSSPPSSTPAPHLRVIRASLAPGPRVCKSICMHTTGRHAMSLRTWAGPGSWRFSTSPAPAPALELRHRENAMKVVCGTVEHAHCCVTPGNGQNHAHFVNHGAL